MALSIVVVSWNTCQLLADCLSSIEDTRGTLPVEVVVVDNASTDGSADMVAGQYPAALLLRNETNVGFAAGNNQGFRAASGKYVLMLNSDTVVHAGALRSMVAALETNG